MLAVGLGPAEVEPYLSGLETEIKIAAINSPNSVTLSGETATIGQVVSQLQDNGVFNRILKTEGMLTTRTTCKRSAAFTSMLPEKDWKKLRIWSNPNRADRPYYGFLQ
jgi:acyl transferase domain-containing protein